MTATKNIETDSYKVTLLTPHIIENDFFDNVVIDIPLVDQIKKINSELSDGKFYGVLTLFGISTEITPETRAHISKASFHKNNLFAAVVAQSIAQKIVGNFYLRINKPKNTTRIFNDRTSALNWLEKELDAYLKNTSAQQN
ncbi:MAG: hypothetical protein V4638_10990 [Bacteroidota bacterium]